VRLAVVTIPLSLVPLLLALREPRGAWMFVVFGAVCIAAPCVGFWLGEMRGQSSEGRAALGCLATLGLFIGYVLFILLAAPRLR
jgi:apolipoprotein N-acyltransferase